MFPDKPKTGSKIKTDNQQWLSVWLKKQPFIDER